MTENLAARGEGLAGLVAKLAERWEAVSKYTSDRGYKTALLSCASELRKTALEAAAPPSTPTLTLDTHKFTDAAARALQCRWGCKKLTYSACHLEKGQSCNCECHKVWATFDEICTEAALATPSPQAPPEQSNAFSTTSAREQSAATAAGNPGAALADEILLRIARRYENCSVNIYAAASWSSNTKRSDPQVSSAER